MRRFLLFAAGVTVGVIVVLKGRELVTKKLPAAVTEQVNKQATGVFDRITEFASEARAASAERESELRDALGLVEDRDSQPTHD
ncbi:MAG TPA: hypothetical protein IAA98_09275 [Candidatus Avipropionibacterium avicola]|uniref:Uncharacterized protein n=1 Tax=Candidatus Avipropionibacterium avicola TaxID=2840701 RepID=A0A9D1GZE2_9ACTN|nr:hypothetical protein [Candidatus Avipropionibacterium avicola]